MNLHRLFLTSALLLPLLPVPLSATGDYWTAPSYLDGSGSALKSTPEFFWHLEVQRLAKKYADKDAASFKPRGLTDGSQFLSYGYISDAPEEEPAVVTRAATGPDLEEFAAAIKSGRFKPSDPAAATEAHKLAREAIDAGKPLPGGEADSEFADYHAGAAAPDSPAAAAAWNKLLSRPAGERHYRSVWAAFMLGKNALAAKDWAGAVKYFEQCRALAKEGFADSLGLAADSYGWQGRAELLAEHYPAAARLYLTQLSLGDMSAIVSLKRFIPEWLSPASGGLPGDALPDDPDAAPPAAPTADEAKTAARWQEAAADPVLQELVTVHILATDSAYFDKETQRCRRWLGVIEKAGLKKVEDATSLAWVAYTAGDYAAAKSWLAKASGVSPLGDWLTAKFALREGKMDAAARILPAVAREIPATPVQESAVIPADRARCEAAALLYAEGQYAAAFDGFVQGRGDQDVKYMIESILTPEECLAAAARIPAPRPSAPPAAGSENSAPVESGDDWRINDIRSQLGRRLIREGRVKDGLPLLTEEERKIATTYIDFAVKAEDKNVPAEERARAWWEAASLMLDSGHLFRGTEDDFHKPSEDAPEWTVRPQRLRGTYLPEMDYSVENPVTPKKTPVFIPASAVEKKRLAATARQHTLPVRTRMVAAGHLQKAAALLPDGTEKKARLLNTVGYWLQDIDNPAADKIYAQLTRSCAGTPTAKAAAAKRWFTGRTNPWE